MKFTFVILLHVFFLSVQAQRLKKIVVLDTSLVESVTSQGTIRFKKLYKPAEIITAQKQKLGLTSMYDFKPVKIEKDITGTEHYRYRQYYKNIPVENATLIIHSKNDTADSADGYIYAFEEDVATETAISRKQSITIALNNCNAQLYNWQDANKEAKAKRNGKTYYPSPELCYYKNTDSSFLLCYKMYVYAVQPSKALQYFINAANGKIETVKNMVHYCGYHAAGKETGNKPAGKKIADPRPLAELNCSYSTVTTPWDGIRPVYAIYNSDHPTYPYTSVDNCTSAVITVTDSLDNIYASSQGSNWDIPTYPKYPLNNRGAGTISWTLRQCNDYFYQRFGRQYNGHDNNGGDIDAYFPIMFRRDDGSYYGTNASYSYDAVGDDEIKFGAGAGTQITDCFFAPDITAHEYTHGVTNYRADLDYESESGALNESYSDIFGEAVERAIRGNCDFYIGMDITAGFNAAGPLYYKNIVRSLVNPQDTGWRIDRQPDRYKGYDWKSTTNLDDDHGGVHRNSGVQNYMFYLLANGGTGYTSNYTAHAGENEPMAYRYEVAAIGFDKAIAIAYASQNYLTETSGYANARNAWVQAAASLYGACSFEAIQTGKAWNSVGLPPPAGNTEQVCTFTYTNGVFYTLGSYDNTITSSTYMIVAGTTCTADVSNAGVLTLQAQDIVFGDGFNAPEGVNIIANNAVNECRYAAY
ncbi:MAG: M4 family metallopeptidase [Ferruginibacter sp.]